MSDWFLLLIGPSVRVCVTLKLCNVILFWDGLMVLTSSSFTGESFCGGLLSYLCIKTTFTLAFGSIVNQLLFSSVVSLTYWVSHDLD